MAYRDALIRRGCVGVLIGLLVTALTGGAPPARAAPAPGHTYVVNSTLDEPDADPVSGLCSSAPSGKCTLRAAIMASIYAAGPNTIILPAGTYTLTRPGYDNAALVGDLDIAHDLTLQGAGSGATIVDGNGAVTRDRVFKVLSTTQSVTMTGLTIRNGQSLSSTAGTIGGGGLLMEGTGQLSLNDVVFAGNTALNGGGLDAVGIRQLRLSGVIFQGNSASLSGGGLHVEGTSQLWLSDAIVEGNTAYYCGGLSASLGYQGGSIELDHIIVHANTGDITGGVCASVDISLGAGFGTIDVHDSQVFSNTSRAPGGGLDVYRFGAGPTTDYWSIERSEIYSNTAAFGGGIENFLPLSLSDSRLHNNNAYYASPYGDGGGGGIYTWAPLTLTRTTLYANTSAQNGGGIFAQSNADQLDNVSVDQSTLSGNSAQYGGGIYYDGFTTPNSLLSLTNSTVSGNGVYRPGGATGTADGGGIYVKGGQAQLFNTTMPTTRCNWASASTITPAWAAGCISPPARRSPLRIRSLRTTCVAIRSRRTCPMTAFLTVQTACSYLI